MVIFLAGLRQIPGMYYEAASVDGATTWTKFTKITLPLLSPIIFFNLVLQVINAFQSFTQAFVVSGGTALAVALTATQTGTAAAVAAFAVLLVLSWAEPYGALAQSAQELGTLASQARAAADLLGEPVAYRDGRTEAVVDLVHRVIDPRQREAE